MNEGGADAPRTGAVDEGLIEVLVQARRLGFLGPGPVLDHVHHAEAFLCAFDGAMPGRGLDLGSGGGVPGLVLALARPAWQWVLVDASTRRTSFLAGAVAFLGVADRVQVHAGRAEDLGRLPGHRASYQLVVARSFARPAVVAECAAPLLAVGGRLVVSEPPAGEDRWPDSDLDVLGLGSASPSSPSVRLVILRQERPCPERYPRRVGIPSKRPLW